MLFRKNMPKACSYCSHGTKLNDEQVLCMKRGVVAAEGSCRKFRYDPCKRQPLKAKLPDFSQFNEHDYSL